MVNPCSLCDATCCKNYLISVTSFDVDRIARRTGKKPDEFAHFYPARILNYDWDTVLQFFDTGPLPDYCLLALKSWPCFFLEKNKCSIHTLSPLICKRYPFDLSGNLIARHCGVASKAIFILKGPDARDRLKEIDAYKAIVKEWNELKGKKEDCMEFILKRSADFKEHAAP